MKRVLLAKFIEISGGIFFIMGALLFAYFGILASLSSEIQLTVALVILLASLVLMEVGIYWIRGFMHISQAIDMLPQERLSAKVAYWSVWAGALRSCLVLLIGFSAMLFFAYFFTSALLQHGKITLTNAFWCLIVSYAVYLFIRPLIIRITKPLAGLVTNVQNSNLPVYTLESDKIKLDLGAGFPRGKREVSISLSELDEVRVFNRYEAIAFQKYNLGPDFQIGIMSMKDIMQYNAGKIERPNYLSWMTNISGAKTIYLRGPKVTYFIGVKNSDGQDLLEAFKRYKNK